MPRKQKQLEDQLAVAQVELKRAEEKVSICKQNVANIKQQIDDRDMKYIYRLLKSNNLTVKQFEMMVARKSTHIDVR